MSQAVTSSVSNHPNVTANGSSNSVYAVTTSTITTVTPCPTPQQQFSPPDPSVPSQCSQLSSYTEGLQVSYMYSTVILK